ncbi:VanZ family protein [Aliidiomarina quisquiliarum]|uniref:VanZ family protein n=1 Tax=Aliidiomarina quisquiliarum TaxID=2938947 RepID=UPI00208DE119|nr:VanZ family protein [Aliidiomarina quisquiliarum]MCO4322696.1 VanZ family protein [Aliidiomarina quisquiliarum]
MLVLHFLRRHGRLIFILTLVLVSFALLAQRPPKPAAFSFQHADKVAHIGVFFVLALTLHLAFRPRVWAGMLLLLLYGVAIEIIQHYVPGRGAELLDVVADMVGAATFYTAWWGSKRLGFFSR